MRKIIAAALLGLGLAPVAHAGVFVLPHFVERAGSVDAGAGLTFDTNLYVTYAANLAGAGGGGGATLDLYLYDASTSLPMQGATTDVCNPCVFTFAAGKRTRMISFDSLIQAAGGFTTTSIRRGFAVVVTSGDADALNVTAEMASGSSATQQNRTALVLQSLPASGGRRLVATDLVATQSSAATSPDSYDSSLFFTYGSGLISGSASAATIDVYVYARGTSQLLTAQGGAVVCGPCVYDLDATNRKAEFRLSSAINAAGGFDAAIRKGFAVVVVRGMDPAGVAVQGWVLNTHSGPFDFSVMGYAPSVLRQP